MGTVQLLLGRQTPAPETIIAIPGQISHIHIHAAADEIRRHGVPTTRRSTRYDVVVDSDRLPPKYVLSVACRLATGQALDPHDFKGEQSRIPSSANWDFRS
jgi:hypothetical protein